MPISACRIHTPGFSGTVSRMDDTNRIISEHVAALPWSVSESARQLGLHRSALYNRLNGSTRWSAAELPAVARLCNTTIGELVGEK